MAEARDLRGAWNETGERLTELGRKLKVHYEQQHGEESQQSRQEFADAARRVGGALQDAVEALGAAARDTSVQTDVKRAGQSLVDALGATLGQASDEVRRAFAERKGEEVAGRASSAAGPAVDAGPESATGTGPAGDGPADDGPAVEPWGTP